MGELFRKKQQELSQTPTHKRPASTEQLDYLRRLCAEAEDDVDEAWLKTLTVTAASREIDKRLGKR